MNRRIYCPINDLGVGAWQALPAMLLLADEVVLWGPAGNYLKSCHNEGHSPFSTKNLLDLVENDIVKVAAREPYLTEPNYRARHSWEGQHWLPEFDDAIREVYRNDACLPAEERRVRSLGPETGYPWARKEAENQSEKYRYAVGLYRANRMPQATRERIARDLEGNIPKEELLEEKAAIEILRDARNNEDVRNELSADLPMSVPGYPIGDFAFLSDRPIGEYSNSEILQLESFRELLKWIASLRHSFDIDVLKRIHMEGKEHRDVFYNLASNTIRPLDMLIQLIELGYKDVSLMDKTLGDTTLSKTDTVLDFFGGLAAIVSAFQLLAKRDPSLTRRKFLHLPLLWSAAGTLSGFGASTQQITGGLAEHASLTPAAYRGPKWPFILQFGTPTPTRAQIEEMIKLLEKVIGHRRHSRRS